MLLFERAASLRPMVFFLRPARWFEASFDRRQRYLTRKIAELRALDGANLAEMGISRHSILPYVFKAA